MIAKLMQQTNVIKIIARHYNVNRENNENNLKNQNTKRITSKKFNKMKTIIVKLIKIDENDNRQILILKTMSKVAKVMLKDRWAKNNFAIYPLLFS